MSYKKRSSPIKKECANSTCKAQFDTWHNSQIYCGQSCNQTSWRRRRGISQAKVKTLKDEKPKVTQSMNWQNIGVNAVGSLAADGLKELGKATVGYQSDELKAIKHLKEEIDRLSKLLLDITKPVQDLIKRDKVERLQKWARTFNPDIPVNLPKKGTVLFSEYSNGVETVYVNNYLRIILKPGTNGKFFEVTDTDIKLKLLPIGNE